MATHPFPVPSNLISIFGDIRLEKHLPRPQTRPSIFICWQDHADEAPFANIKTEHQKWPVKPFISGRSGTQYVAMVTKMVCSYYGTHLLESYCKEPCISDTNWLRYLSPSYSTSKFGWVYDIITWLICILKKLEYLQNKKRYLKMVNSILLLVQTTCLCAKMA